jgi:anti-sigma-K factor RskA
VNIYEYISSGIVESYVLGLADQDEREHFERMCNEHPEVREAREAFELSLEEHAMRNAIQPAPHLKTQILSRVKDVNPKQRREISPLYPEEENSKAFVGPVYAKTRWRYLAAASLLFLVGSVALNLYFFSQYQRFARRYDELLANQSQLAQNNQALQTRLKEYQTTMEIMRSPYMAVITMPGRNVPTSPDSTSLATVYWNTRSKDVYLMIDNLPAPQQSQQYQLWAIVDGKPIDAGLIDTTDRTTLHRMKNIPRAQVFAITLEKKGGSTTPQGPMYVLGRV